MSVRVSALLKNAVYMLHSAKPKLMARAAMGYAKKLTGGHRLRYADIIVHYACNLQCGHCSCETLRDDSRRTLTPSEWGGVARQCEDLGVITFGVQGGEPLIYDRLDEVIHNLHPERNFISIKTNGRVNNPGIYKHLRHIGVDSVTVGFGTVLNQTPVETVQKIIDAGMKPMMSYVISHNSIRSNTFKEIIHLAKQFGCVLNCSLAVPVGAWETDKEIMLTKEDRAHLNETMRKHRHVRTDFQTNWMKEGCGGMKEKIYISPYGDVLPCPFVHISFGNVLEEPLETIWRRGCQSESFREYAPVCLAAEDREFQSYLRIPGQRPIDWRAALA